MLNPPPEPTNRLLPEYLYGQTCVICLDMVGYSKLSEKCHFYKTGHNFKKSKYAI